MVGSDPQMCFVSPPTGRCLAALGWSYVVLLLKTDSQRHSVPVSHLLHLRFVCQLWPRV